jgi:hypothetical protein
LAKFLLRERKDEVEREEKERSVSCGGEETGD